MLAGQLDPLGASPLHQVLGPVPHRRLITHQRHHTTRPEAGSIAVDDEPRVVVIGVILPSPRRSAADPQVTSGQT